MTPTHNLQNGIEEWEFWPGMSVLVIDSIRNAKAIVL